MNKEKMTVSQKTFKYFSFTYKVIVVNMKKYKLHKEMVARYLKCLTLKTDESLDYPNLIYII